MQTKFKVEHGSVEPSTVEAEKSLGDAMKKLNIIDMTGSAVQI